MSNDDIGNLIRAVTALCTVASALLGLIIASRMSALPTKDDHKELVEKVEATKEAIAAVIDGETTKPIK